MNFMSNTEIERKFLIKNDDWKNDVQKSYPIKQGYFPGDFALAVVRVRTKGDKGFLTIKGPTKGISRVEYEYEIPVTEAEEMVEQFCSNANLTKVRHIVEYAGHTWEIDEFSGRHVGLVIAEVEINSIDEEVELPSWVGEEVSSDPRYYNAKLVFDEKPEAI